MDCGTALNSIEISRCFSAPSCWCHRWRAPLATRDIADNDIQNLVLFCGARPSCWGSSIRDNRWSTLWMLPRQIFLTHPKCTKVHGFDGIHHDGNEGVIRLLEAIGGVHIDAWEPASVAGMRVVPSDDVMGVDSAVPLRIHYVMCYLRAMRTSVSLSAVTLISDASTGRKITSLITKMYSFWCSW